MRVACAVGLVLGALSFSPLRRHVAATKVLLHLSGKAPEVGRAALDAATEVVVSWPSGSAKARLYVPNGRAEGCVVVGHGVHYLGIEEPRLVRFARELKGARLVVLTPLMADLADYRITRASADVLAASVVYLAARCGGPVGLIGFSFAGGLSLLVAEDPRVGAHLKYVTSVGGYDDLSRVRRFLLNDEVETLHGLEPRRAHEYGQVVLLCEHLGAFVPAQDLPTMQAAIKAWLHGDRARAWLVASRRQTGEAERVFMSIVNGHTATYRDALGALLTGTNRQSRALSPASKFGRITVPVYLLHGSGDSVIPPEETLWADRELRGHAHHTLVTPLLEHVEVSGAPRWQDQVALVQFMARLF